MSTYELAPALDLVATACCVCGRPLLDAVSLKSGIGPVCAEKTGYGRVVLSSEDRAEVNRLVYELAAIGCDVRAIARLQRLRELGFDTLAARIELRLESLVDIHTGLVVGSDPPRVWVTFPRLKRREEFDALLVEVRRIPGRRWEVCGTDSRNTFPRTRSAFLAFKLLLANHFPGRVVRGLKSLYVVTKEDGHGSQVLG